MQPNGQYEDRLAIVHDHTVDLGIPLAELRKVWGDMENNELLEGQDAFLSPILGPVNIPVHAFVPMLPREILHYHYYLASGNKAQYLWRSRTHTKIRLSADVSSN